MLKDLNPLAGPRVPPDKKPGVAVPESSSRKLPESNVWQSKKAYRYNSGVYYKGERK